MARYIADETGKDVAEVTLITSPPEQLQKILASNLLYRN